MRPCWECTVLPRASDASDAIPLAGQPPPAFCACAQSNRSAVEPTSRPARSRQRSNPREASFTHPKTRSSSPPFGRLRHPRHRPVILGGGQPPSSASRSRLPLPRKAACHRVPSTTDVLPAGAFHTAPVSPTDESMSDTSNAIMTSRSRPLHRGPMTGLPSVPGLDVPLPRSGRLGSSALASFVPWDIAASR